MIYIYNIILFSGLLLMIISLTGFGQPRVSLKRVIPELREENPKFKIITLPTKVSKFFVDKFKIGNRMKPKLEAAKIKISTYDFFALQVALCVVLAMFAIGLFGQIDPLKIILAFFLGYLLPDLWVRRRIIQRKRQIVRVLPETIDLLGLCIEAGLDFTMAIKWIVEKLQTNPFLEELEAVAEEIKLGKSRSDALRDMSKKLNITEVSSLVHTLVQSERLGTPVAETFTILSEDTRQQRFRRGERMALKAPLKLLIPLIFCILPVIAIVVGGPIMLQFAQGGLFKLGQ